MPNTYRIIDQHSELVGLNHDDHDIYVNISGIRTIYVPHIFNTSTFPFQIGNSSSGILVHNLNADMLDGHHWSEISGGGSNIGIGSVGNVLMTSPTLTTQWGSILFDTSDINSINYNDRSLKDSNGNTVIDWSNAIIYDLSSRASIDWNTRKLLDTDGNVILDWNTDPFVQFIENPMIAIGDIIVGGVDGDPLRFIIGAGGNTLQASFDDPDRTLIWRDAFYDSTNAISVDYTNRKLYNVDGDITLDFSIPAFINPMTDRGDIIFASNAEGAASRLPVGDENSILISRDVGSGDIVPRWQTMSIDILGPIFTSPGQMLTALDIGQVGILEVGPVGAILNINNDDPVSPEWNIKLVDDGGNDSVQYQDRKLIAEDGVTEVVDYRDGRLKLKDNGGFESVNWGSGERELSDGVNTTVAWASRQLKYFQDTNKVVVDWSEMILNRKSSFISIDWENSQLIDSTSVLSANYDERKLYGPDGVTVTLDWNTIVGSELSGYLQERDLGISGYIINWAISNFNTITNTINISGYLAQRIIDVSGYIVSQLGAGAVTQGQLSTLSGYLDSRDFALSGYIDNKYNTIANAVNISGYLAQRIIDVSGYIVSQLGAGAVTQGQLSTLSGYLDGRDFSLSGYLTTFNSNTYNTIANTISISGYLQNRDTTISGYLETKLNNYANSISGYLDGRDFTLSGYLTGWASSTFDTISNASSISGYLQKRDTDISGYLVSYAIANFGTITNDTNVSGYFENKLTNYYTKPQIDGLSGYINSVSGYLVGWSNATFNTISNTISISGYLSQRIIDVSGYANTKYDTILNSTNISGYLQNRDTDISGYLVTWTNNTFGTIANDTSVSGYLQRRDTDISGYLVTWSNGIFGTIVNDTNVSGYLQNRDTSISGYIITYANTTFDTITNATNISGYLQKRDADISGYFTSFIAANYNTISNTINISGYLDGRDLAISGYIVNWANSTFGTTINDSNASGYLQKRDTDISGYIINFVAATYDTIVNVANVSGYFASQLGGGGVTQGQLSTVSGYLDGRDFTLSGYLSSNINASNLTTGTVPTARLGTGTANTVSYLRGDNTWNNPYIPTVLSTLTTGGVAVTTDVSTGHQQDIRASGNFTLNNPTNPTNGQRFVWRIINVGGGSGACTVSLGNAFRFGSDITGLSTVASGKVDYLGCMYNTMNNAASWDVVAYMRGF